MDHRQLVRMLAVGRLVLGGTLLLAPQAAGGRWLGPVSADRGAKVAIRGLAARDLAIGAGTLQALGEGQPVRGWALAGGIGDLADAAATVLAWRTLGIRRALPTLVVAATASAVSLTSANHLD
jgi:hypothetical protein